MPFERILDVIVLITTLLGGAAAVLLLLSSLVLDKVPDHLARGRWVLLSIVALGAALLLVEWLVIH
ncbi:MAG: hypothetical protein M3P18_10480 [Actinomycetota bacterium]|nr:hypothetical protein [Actinomycetota bacterium]